MKNPMKNDRRSLHTQPRDARIIQAIQKHFPEEDLVVIGGNPYTTADLVRLFEHLIEVADDADEAEWHQFLQQRRALRAQSQKIHAELRGYVAKRFARNRDALADFGQREPHRRHPRSRKEKRAS